VSKAETILIWVGVLTLVVGFLGAVAAWIVVPEFRAWTGLEKASQVQTPPSAPLHSATPSASGYQKDSGSASDELPGMWVDLVRNQFYRLGSNGKVELRFHRFDEPNILSQNMTWYRVGQSVHLSDTGPTREDCEGTLNGDVIRGSCNTQVGKLSWVLHQLENQAPPRKITGLTPRKPEPTDGIWVDNSIRAGGKPVFLEFLSSGKVKKRYGLDGGPFVAQDTWYKLGEVVRLTEFIRDGTFECEGKPQGDTIEGTCKSLATTGSSFAWKMDRVRK
jgi:hypothetical protein